jgi:hypothetical protein
MDYTAGEGEWARKRHVDPKTVHRLFVRATDSTFGEWRRQGAERVLPQSGMIKKTQTSSLERRFPES